MEGDFIGGRFEPLNSQNLEAELNSSNFENDLDVENSLNQHFDNFNVDFDEGIDGPVDYTDSEDDYELEDDVMTANENLASDEEGNFEQEQLIDELGLANENHSQDNIESELNASFDTDNFIENELLGQEYELSDENIAGYIQNLMSTIRTRYGALDPLIYGQDHFIEQELNMEPNSELENSINGLEFSTNNGGDGYNMNDSFVSESNDLYDDYGGSEEDGVEEGADLSKLKETDYKIAEKKDEKQQNSSKNASELNIPTVNCAICMEDIKVGDKIIKLRCDHIFHSACILNWVKDKNSCPYCRKAVTG